MYFLHPVLQNKVFTRINELLSTICIHYATKVADTPSHRLNHLIPPQQSQVAKQSKRLTDRCVLRPRTSLYSKSLFSVLTECYKLFFDFFLTDRYDTHFFHINVNMVLLAS